MSAQRHAILRQTLELSVAADADAWALQDAARRAQAGIRRLLECCCDELSAPDRLHRIARLELDLGTLAPHRFEEDFVAKMAAALGNGLAAAIAGLEAGGSPPKDESQWELLAQYLRLGRLPWWADVAAPGQPQASLALLLQEAADLLRHRMPPLLTDGHVLRRLAGHFADQVLARLAALLLPQLGSYPGALAQALIPVGGDAPGAGSAAAWRSRVWQGVLGNAVPASMAAASRLDYSRSVLLRLASGRLGDYRRLVRQAQDAAGTAGRAGQTGCLEVSDVLARLGGEPPTAERTLAGNGAAPRPPEEDVLAAVAQQPGQWAPADFDTASRPGPLPGQGGQSPLPVEEPVPARARRVQQLCQQRTDPPAAVVTDAVPVVNAGLVILWPFLKTFLERLGLLGEKGFRDEMSRQRGAILLHCLASGEAEAPEYLLPLNKVLCGLPLDASFEADGPLRTEDIEECERLLAAVIGQVPVLNKMSVAGFRGSFLLRAGMLGVRDGAWLLRVERETHDLVLDRFPWGFEWVKLPWMEAAMQVEW